MIQAIIVDDEELSLISLEKKLQAFPSIHIAKTYFNHECILTDIQNEKIDVAFLDIEMAELNGLNLAEKILSIQPSIHIVFVTAHTEYAVQAFEINSIDYLLKPVMTRRLEKTINRLIDKIQDVQSKAPSTSPLQITCFTELQVFHHDQPLHFKTAKVKELFGLLVTHINTFINRDILIDKLWPEHDYKKSKVNLHTSLSHLRKMLDQLGYTNCITFSNQSYSFSIKPIYCDTLDFDQSFQNLDILDVTNIQLAEKTIHLYTGSYMELNGYEWAYEKSQEYHKKVMSLLSRVIDYYKNIDDNKTLYYLQFQRKLDPYLDESIKHSMQLLIQQGRRYEAIKMYQEYKDLLLNDLGIEPEETVTHIFKSLVTT